MPTVLESTVECPFDVAVLWALKQSSEVDHALAQEDGRVLSIDEEEQTQDGRGRRYVKRVTNMRILKNPLPVWIQKILKLKNLDFKIKGQWWQDLCSEEQPLTFEVYSTQDGIAGKFSITGFQYIEPLEGGACNITSRVQISVPVAFVGGIVERILKDQLQTSYRALPALLQKYIDSNGMPDIGLMQRKASLMDKASRTETGYHEQEMPPCGGARLSCLQMDTSTTSTTRKTRVAGGELEAQELLHHMPCWRRACLKVLGCLCHTCRHHGAPSEVLPQECVELKGVIV